MEWLNIVGSFSSVVGAIFALLGWLKAGRIQKEMDEEKTRQAKRVKIAIQHGGRQIVLPSELRRNECSRAEVLGRIGMIPTREKGKRFAISYLSTSEFLEQLNIIEDGNGEGLLTIPCDESEFNQFQL